MAAARGATAAYPLLLALGALDATGYSVIVPVAPAIADATGAGPATIGLLVASFPAGMVAGFALAGWLVRVAGAKRLLAGSLVLVALGALGFVFGDSLAAYFPSRSLMGVGSGGIWIGVTFDTLERWPGQEYVCMSRVFAAYSVGGLIGPALGVVGGIQGPFLAYIVLLVLAMPLVLLVGEPSTRRDFAADRGPLRSRGFWLASAAIMFAVLALGVLEGVLPLHFAERLSQAQIGALYVGRVVRGRGHRERERRHEATATRPRSDRAGRCSGSPSPESRRASRSGSSPCSSPRSGSGSANTGSLGLLVEAVPVERIVTAMVVWSQIGIVGYLLGPLVGGFVAEGLGYAYLGLVPGGRRAPVRDHRRR